MSEEKNRILETAVEAAKKAGVLVRERFGNSRVQEKASNNLVTQADMEAEKMIIDMIRARFPDHQILSEETYSETDLLSPSLWVIDPLDGTNNFAHGIPLFCVSVAYASHGVVQAGVIYDPMRDECFSTAVEGAALLNGAEIGVSDCSSITEAIVATGFHYDRGELARKTLSTMGRLLEVNVRGFRRTGSAALDLCWIACGRFDGYFEYKLSPWDYAAGMQIVRQAGGQCLDRNGAEADLETTGIIAGPGSLMPPFLTQVLYDR